MPPHRAAKRILWEVGKAIEKLHDNGVMHTSKSCKMPGKALSALDGFAKRLNGPELAFC